MKVCLKCAAKISNKGWQCTSCGWTPEFQDGFPLLAPGLAAGGANYPTGSHDLLAQIEADSFWFVSRNKLLSYLLDRFFPNAGSMLEIGCGTGFVLSGLAQHRPGMIFFGAEAYPSGLKHAQKRVPKAEFAQMDACQIPFSEEFDVIGAFDVLEHIQDDKKALQEINKALMPEGGMIITVPQHPWLWTKTDERGGHKRRYTRAEMRKKAEAAGFHVLMMTSFISLLLPFMLASRWINVLSENKFESKTKAGIRLSGIVNSLFTNICTQERTLIRLSVPLPFGGSLVCVAKKGRDDADTT